MSIPSPFEPPSASLAALPGQRPTAHTLPTPLTPLLGREVEVGEACAMLDADETRLVTLLGPGGIGKTRLAVAIADRMAGDFAHGACFVALASVRDPDLVPAAVAQALGLQEASDRPASDLVVTALRDRHLLLVLDNLEHVVGRAAPWLGDLLGACPRVKALVTSRIALQIAGEQRFPVQPLDLPAVDSGGDLERVSRSAAVQLFLQRAIAVRPDFTLSERNADAVRDICRALDGLPLAIELAATRVRVLSPTALLARLTGRLDLLQSGLRDAQPRHQTMREAIDWSHDLLTPDQQRLYRRLSVFTGGFSLEAAEAVGAGGDAARLVLDLVTDLIDHSLVRQVSTEDDDARYEMLEVIREYGLERLDATGETTAARDAHAAWCLDLAKAAASGIEGSDQLAWLGRLDAELHNIRSALAWLRERERIDEAQDLAGRMPIFFLIRGFYTEARAVYEALVAHPLGTARTMGRAASLNGLGMFALIQGDAPRAIEAHDEAVSIYRQLNARRQLARALMHRGIRLQAMGRIDEAYDDSLESLELSTGAGDLWGEATARVVAGLVLSQRGELDDAWAQMQASADLCRTIGESWVLSINLGNLAVIALRRGESELAASYQEEAIQLNRAIGEKHNLAISLVMQADVDRARGDTVSAERHLREALAVAREMGDPYQTGYALLSLGTLATSAGEVDRAVPLLRDAITHLARLGSSGDVGTCLDAFVDVAIAKREASNAARWIGATDAAQGAAGVARFEATPGEHKARVAAIVATLGGDGYRAAWEAGHALSTDDAIAEALAWEPAHREGATSGMTPDAASGPAASLSPRELEVLRLMADGLTNQEIADRLFLSRRTATSHASNILGKLNLSRRTAAVAFALRNGLA